MNFDIDVSQSANHYADIYITDMTAINLSEYDSNGFMFLWVYTPDVTYVNQFTLRWGSANTDYWSDSVTTQHDETIFANGWNVLKFSWRDAAIAGPTGSPNSSALDYIMLRIQYTSSQVDMTDVRVDDIVCGYISDLKVGNFTFLIDEKLQYAIKGIKSSRHRIINNLPGTADFCPLIYKTEILEQYINSNLSKRKRTYLKTIGADVLQRASAF